MAKRSKKSSRVSTHPGSALDPNEAGAWQYHEAKWLGLDVEWMTKEQAYGIIRRMKLGTAPMEAAKEMRLPVFKLVPLWRFLTDPLKELGLPWKRCRSNHHAGLMLDAHLEPLKFFSNLFRQIDKATSAEMLEMIGRELWMVQGVLRQDYYAELVAEGRKRREEIESKKPQGEAF